MLENQSDQTPTSQKYDSPYAHDYVPRINHGGNFCGHYPQSPRFLISVNPHVLGVDIDELGDHRRPAILYQMCEKINGYYDDPDTIPSFNSANSHRRSSDRKRNSARRKALIDLTTVMVMNMDLSSLRVGYPTPEGFICRSVKWLAKKAKLSFSSCKRAMSDLLASGIISSYQYKQLINQERQEYRFHVAVRVFQPAFFALIGIDTAALIEAQRYALNKLQKKAQAFGTSVRGMAMIALHFCQITHQNGKKGKALHNNNEDNAIDLNRYLAKRRTQIIMDLMDQQPDLLRDEAAFKDAVEEKLREAGVQLDQAKE